MGKGSRAAGVEGGSLPTESVKNREAATGQGNDTLRESEIRARCSTGSCSPRNHKEKTDRRKNRQKMRRKALYLDKSSRVVRKNSEQREEKREREGFQEENTAKRRGNKKDQSTKGSQSCTRTNTRERGQRPETKISIRLPKRLKRGQFKTTPREGKLKHGKIRNFYS